MEISGLEALLQVLKSVLKLLLPRFDNFITSSIFAVETFSSKCDRKVLSRTTSTIIYVYSITKGIFLNISTQKRVMIL